MNVSDDDDVQCMVLRTSLTVWLTHDVLHHVARLFLLAPLFADHVIGNLGTHIDELKGLLLGFACLRRKSFERLLNPQTLFLELLNFFIAKASPLRFVEFCTGTDQ